MRTVYQGGQQDEAWRALRLGCATASNFGAVMAKGVGGGEAATRRDYRIKLALELFTGQPSGPMPPSWDMRIGIEREPEARNEFELETGLLLRQVSFVKLDGQLVGCSPDALIGTDSGLEAKCPKESTHLEYLSLTTKPPAVYVPQVQGCMYVTGRSSWHFCSYNSKFPPELRLHWIKVERDEAYIKKLADELFAFNFEVQKTVKEIGKIMERKRKVFCDELH